MLKAFGRTLTGLDSWIVKLQESYTYEALPEGDTIRLLELYPGVENDSLQSRLHVVHITTAPAYEAISYVWGNSTRVETITCAGEELGITRNLSDVLRRIRLEDKSRYVWADAICINQRDIKERSQQVRLMGDIYRKALRVLVWLRRGEVEDGDNAFPVDSFLRELNAQLEESLPGWKPRLAKGSYTGIRPDDIDNPQGWRALARLTDQDWFYRTWVQQEIGLASEALVMYGKASCTWKMLIYVLAFVSEFQSAEFSNQYGILSSSITVMDQEFRKPLAKTFLDVCEFQRTRHCSDPRDRIFAMLEHPSARSAGGTKTIIVPDYSKTQYEVYHELAVQILRQSKSLLILSSVQHVDRANTINDTRLPTWAPWWDTPVYNNNLYACNRKHWAAGTSRPQFEHVAASRLLVVRGTQVDNIARYSRVLDFEEFDDGHPEDPISRPQINPVQELWYDHVALQGETDYVSGGSVLDAYSLTLTSRFVGLGGYSDDSTGINMSSHKADFAAYCQRMDRKNGGQTAFVTRGREGEGSAASFARDARLSCGYKRFFSTSKGYFGTGPQALRDDDMICVLFGFNLPVVLRRAGSQWKFVGACYVHGLMKGEAIEMFQKGELVEDQFTLC
jgi:hypothetical protein